MDTKVVILGAGEHARVAENILRLNGIKDITFLDDFSTHPDVKGRLEEIEKFGSEYSFFIGMGNNAMREKWFNILKKSGKKMINAIHPHSTIEKSVTLGENVMIGAHSYICINTRIGNNVIINNGCSIDHDNIIEDHVQIAPGVTTGGKVRIKKGNFIGIGATIIDHINIEGYNVIGGGAVLVDNLLEKKSLYLGVPAKKVKDL